MSIASNLPHHSLKAPKGHKVLQKDEMRGHTFSLMMKGGRELNVHLTDMAIRDIANLERMATMIGPKKLTKKATLADGGFMVIKAREVTWQEVWVHKKAGDKSVTAKCTGPADMIAFVEEMCTSLTVK